MDFLNASAPDLIDQMRVTRATHTMTRAPAIRTRFRNGYRDPIHRDADNEERCDGAEDDLERVLGKNRFARFTLIFPTLRRTSTPLKVQCDYNIAGSAQPQSHCPMA